LSDSGTGLVKGLVKEQAKSLQRANSTSSKTKDYPNLSEVHVKYLESELAKLRRKNDSEVKQGCGNKVELARKLARDNLIYILVSLNSFKLHSCMAFKN
jgi:hypothetical protein